MIAKKMTLERIVYTDKESGYFIGVTTNGNTVEGEVAFFPPCDTEMFVIAVQTQKPAKSGNGFVHRIKKLFYSDDDSITKMLLYSNMLKGISESKSQGMFEELGNDVWSILDACLDAPSTFINHNERMMLPEDIVKSVNGVGPIVFEQIIVSWAARRKLFKFMKLVVKCGLSKRQYSELLSAFGEELATEMILKNPYELTSLENFEWFDADIIGQLEWPGKEAIPLNSEKRYAAALREAIRINQETEGNMASPEPEIVRLALNLLSSSDESGLIQILKHKDEYGMVGDDGEFVTTEKIFSNTMNIVSGLDAVRNQSDLKMPTNIDVDKYCSFKMSAQQRNAVSGALESPVFSVTGGPGTGKTSAFLSTFVSILKKHGFSYILCAPTGAASVRITATTGEFAATIHRVFDINGKFPSCPDVDVIIFDESSMIDEELLGQVMKLIAEKNKMPRVVFIGDVDQLPPVGPGFPFRDILKAYPSVRLDQVFRQAKGSSIILAAHAINKREMPSVFDDDFKIVNTGANYLPAVMQAFKELQKDMNADDIQILTPMNKTRSETNKVMQEYLNPNANVVKPLSYAVGDRVIQTKNNYNLIPRATMNGEIGICQSIREDLIIGAKTNPDPLEDCDKVIEASFVDYEKYPNLRPITIQYPWASSNQLQLAYCVTVHKSQGSQYKAVIIVLTPASRENFLLKEIPFTAVTRSIEKCIIINVNRSMERFIHGPGRIRRYSFLEALLEKSQKETSV